VLPISLYISYGTRTSQNQAEQRRAISLFSSLSGLRKIYVRAKNAIAPKIPILESVVLLNHGAAGLFQLT
jgi:hypothetical protein